MTLATLQPTDPVRIGSYWLAGRLGEGGQGIVYEAYDAAGTRVALKTLRDGGTEQFDRELRAVRRVASFCTARVLAADLSGERPYIVSEYVEGPSLRRAVEQAGPFSGDALHRLVTAIATALAAIHEAGVVHRDLKPDNVLLGPDGPRVIDFGIARTEDMTASTVGSVKGTPLYMAPETFTEQRVGPPADVFAWGAIAVYAATGTDLFSGGTLAAVMHRVLTVDPDLSRLPDALRPLVAAALAKNPDARPDARGLLMALLGGRDSAALLRQGSQAGAALRSPLRQEDPSIGIRAERVYEELPPADREMVPAVLLRLVTVDEDGEEMLRRAGRDELADLGDHDRIERVLAAFSDAGLLESGASVQVAHPALLRAWPRLHDWLQEEYPGLKIHRRLSLAARTWDTGGRKDGDTLRGGMLESCLVWAATGRRQLTLTRLERAFLDACVTRTKRDRRRRRLVTATMSVLLAAALTATMIAVRQSELAAARTVEVARQRDQAAALALAAQAERLRGTLPKTAMLLNVAAWRIADLPETRGGLYGALAQPQADVFTDPDVRADTITALSLDGRTLVSGENGTVRVWDVPAHRRIAVLEGVGGPIRNLAVGSDRRLVAVQTGAGVRVWDVRSGRPVGAPFRKDFTPFASDRVEFTPDGRRLYLPPGVDGSAFGVWDIDRRDFVTAPDGEAVQALSPDGRLGLATTGLWDLRRRVRVGSAELTSGKGYSQPVFSPDGRLVAVDVGEGVEVWDATTGRPPQFGPLRMSKVTFSPDGDFAAGFTGEGLTLRRLGDGVDLMTVPFAGQAIAAPSFSRDGKLLRQLADGGSVLTVDVSPFTRPHRVTPGTGESGHVLSPDGKLMAFVRGGQVHTVDVATGRRAHAPITLAPSGSAVRKIAIAWHPGGRALATGLRKDLALWDLDTGKRTASATIRDGNEVDALRFAPDGRTVSVTTLALDEDEDRATPLELWTPPADTTRVVKGTESASAVAFSPDGRRLILGPSPFERGAYVIDPAAAKVLSHLGGKSSSPGGVPAFSPDGRTLTMGDANGRVVWWNTSTWRPTGPPLAGHDGAIVAAAHSPTGQVLATADDLRTIRLWDARTGRPLGMPIIGHLRSGISMAFSPDGGRLYSVDSTGVLRTTVIDAKEAAASVCARAGRTLTREEWRQHASGVPYSEVCPKTRGA